MSQIKKNYAYNLLFQIVSVIIPFITTPYIARVLGPTPLGEYDFTAGIVSYFGILALTGTHHYGQREVAILQDRKHDRTVVFAEVQLFRTICITATLLLYLLFIQFFYTDYKNLLYIQALTFVYMAADISWFFQGIEKVRKIAIRNIIARVVTTILIFIFVRSEKDFYLYVLFLMASFIAANVSLWFELKKETDSFSFRELQLKRHLKGIMELFIPVVAIQIYAVLDKTMLGSIVNATEVGYYAQAEKVVRLALTVFTALVTVLIPRIAAVYAKGDKEAVLAYFNKALMYLAFISMPMMIGLIAVSDKFVPLFFGADFMPVIPLLQILAFLFPILGTGHLIGGVMISIKYTKVYNRGVISAAVINVVFNLLFLLAFRMGAIGVSISTIIAELTCAAIQMVVFSKMYNGIRVFSTFSRYLIPALFMGAAVFFIKQLFGNLLASLLVSVGAGAVIYFTILLLAKDACISEGIHWVKGRFGKKS